MYINVSASFVARTKCKFCLTGPKNYFAYYTFNYDLDMEKEEMIYQQKHAKRFCSNWYQDSAVKPSSMTHMCNLGKYYRSSVSATVYKGNQKDSTHYIEYCMCDCRKTVWFINELQGIFHPEIKNRISRIQRRIGD
jgi:hypothetical protein